MATVSEPRTIRTLADLLHSLGDISPARVPARPLPGTATEADVVRLRQQEKKICELVDGFLVEKLIGYMESILACELIRLIGNFLKESPLGLVAGEAGMMQLTAGLVRIPDVSFVSWDRLPERRLPTEQVPHLVPDLAVEVLSPGNTEAEMNRKLREYFHHGSRLVWIVDPRAWTVAVHTTPADVVMLNEHDTLLGEPVLPGFRVSLRDLFAELDGAN